MTKILTPPFPLFGDLDFGNWDLFGAWDLVIGIYRSPNRHLCNACSPVKCWCRDSRIQKDVY
jgi:hypothetical protein